MRTARLFTVSHSIPCTLGGLSPPPTWRPIICRQAWGVCPTLPRMQIPMDADPFSPDADPLPRLQTPLMQTPPDADTPPPHPRCRPPDADPPDADPPPRVMCMCFYLRQILNQVNIRH